MFNFTPPSLEQDLTLQHRGQVGQELVTHVLCTVCKKVLDSYKLPLLLHVHTDTCIEADRCTNTNSVRIVALGLSAKLPLLFLPSADIYSHTSPHQANPHTECVCWARNCFCHFFASPAWFLAFLENKELSVWKKEDENHNLIAAEIEGYFLAIE